MKRACKVFGVIVGLVGIGVVSLLPVSVAHAKPVKAEKVMICHMPGTKAEREMSVPAAAVDGHLAHGDQVGLCSP